MYRCMECGKQIEKGAAHLRGNLRTVRAWCRKCWGSEGRGEAGRLNVAEKLLQVSS